MLVASASFVRGPPSPFVRIPMDIDYIMLIYLSNVFSNSRRAWI